MEEEVIEKQGTEAPAEIADVAEEVDEVAGEMPAEEAVEPQEGDPEELHHGQSSELVNRLRKLQRETAKQRIQAERKAKQLEEQLQAMQAPKEPQTLGEKPKLADFDYDADAFESALETWHTKKRAVDEQQAQRRAAIEAQEREWANRLQSYTREKEELADPDFEEAEWTVQHSFNETQQGIMLTLLDKPARFIAAIGRDPELAAKLAAIKDPVKFTGAVALADFQRNNTMATKKAPPPERVISGGVRAQTSNTALDRLREKAAKTGDYSEVVAYKAQLRKNNK